MRFLFRLLLILVLLLVGYAVLFADRSPEVAQGTVVVLDVQGAYVESAAPPLLSRLTGDSGTPLLALYAQLRKAERDPRVEAVVLRIGRSQLGWAKAQEIRASLGRLRDAGKKTVAYVEIEPIGANVEYYLATAAETVWIAPGARIPFIGLAAEYLFLGGLFDKLGVDFEVERVGPFKTASDQIAGRTMSPQGREMANWLLDSFDEQFIGGIAEARGLEAARVRELIEESPSAPAQLIEAGLVDRQGFLSDILEELGSQRPVLEHAEWAQVRVENFEPQATVALVYGSGNVVTGEGQRTRGGSPVLAGRTVSKALVDAANDETIDAILFRIDSPGGSALASDMVWHASQVAKGKKPLIVSFSDVAASGGYYVACGADAIYAEPGTLTGSIGVVMVRPIIQRLYEKLGIGFEVLTRGDHARLFTLTQPLDAEDRQRLQDEVERTYQLFLDRVEAGRPIPRDQIESVGRGRVWTGVQAKEHGLVDHLGGLHAAVGGIRERLSLKPDADVALMVYPPPQPLAQQLTQLLRSVAMGVAQPPLALPEPLARVFAWFEGVQPGAPALLPPLVVNVD